MTDEKHNAGTTQRLWASHGAQLLGTSESAVLMLIGVALVLVAVLLLYSSMHDLYEAVYRGPGEIEHKAVEILNTVLFVSHVPDAVVPLSTETKVSEPRPDVVRF